MADKKLLEEATIRRFMKLANISSNESGMLSEGVGTPYDKKVAKSSKNSIKVNGRKPGKGLVREAELEEEGLEEAELEEESLEEAELEEEGLEEMYREEEAMVQEEEDEEAGSEDPMGGMDAGAGDVGGGDVKASVEKFVKGLAELANELLGEVGSDESVEAEAGDEATDDMGDVDPMGDMEGGEDDAMTAPVAEKKEKKPFPFNRNEAKKAQPVDEEIEESIELVDEELVEALLNRVTARLVAEARAKNANKEDPKKKKKVEEGKSSGGMKAHPKGYKTHPVGKGTPFKGTQKILGLKGKHQAKKSR